jgi:hypothetical protein
MPIKTAKIPTLDGAAHDAFILRRRPGGGAFMSNQWKQNLPPKRRFSMLLKAGPEGKP